MADRPKLSFVFVNYNVKEYLDQALQSVLRAVGGISHEIYVVDNASVDDSVEHIRRRFPAVNLIASDQNLGFGRANNVALQRVRGEFIVIINPDTVVQEDTFGKLLAFFDEYPQAGAATCKIINPDGSFSVDCRHSIPTPMTAFWKVTGFSKLFPDSRVFAKYHLTYLPEDEIYPVPAISGSFMMIRKTVLDEVGFFDERFFMYCEDIDLCHRINEAGHRIYYVPTSQIIHYKGESTKKHNLDYVITFNKALYQFFRKYYADGSIFIFRWIITLGIVLRGLFIYLRNFLHRHFPLLLDAAILNVTLLLAFVIRLSVKSGFMWTDFVGRYWVINAISTAVFLGAGYYLEVYPHHRLSIQGIIKANLLTFILVASLTFFLNQFAFSRMVVLITAIISPVLMLLWRSILKRYYRGDRSAWGKDVFSRPTIIVGSSQSAAALYRKIRSMKDISYDLVGIVVTELGDDDAQGSNDIPLLGQSVHLAELARIHRVQQVIFDSESLSYENILKSMSSMAMERLEYKIAPSHLEVVIGKSTIERLDDYPLMDIEYSIGKPFNRASKRLLDLLIAIPAYLIWLPGALFMILLRLKKLRKCKIPGKGGRHFGLIQIDGYRDDHWLNRWLQLAAVIRGKLSLVGAPMSDLTDATPNDLRFLYKPGIFGLAGVNKTGPVADEEKYHLFYLKNQSVFLDLEILLKLLFRGNSKAVGE